MYNESKIRNLLLSIYAKSFVFLCLLLSFTFLKRSLKEFILPGFQLLQIQNYFTMKTLLRFTISLILLVFLGITVQSQNYVSTEPLNKNAILEEFTGVRCPNCPAGHQVAANILAANPGRAFVMGCHPGNSSYTQPYGSDPDFRRTYLNAFYSTPYCGSSRFMPSAFISRRVWGNGERIQSRTVWPQYCDIIMAEASPLNVGLSSTYNDATNTLDVTVEVYYTADVTQDTYIYCEIAEIDLIAQQSGGSAAYVHKHVFRESFVAQWGDLIPGPTTQGTLVVFNYSFDNTTAQYVMDNCDLLAFVLDGSNDEIISGNGAAVGESTQIEPSAAFSADDTSMGVGHPVQYTDESTGGPDTWAWEFPGGDPATSDLQDPPPVYYNTPGTYDVTLTVSNSLGTSTEIKAGYMEIGYVPQTDFSASSTSIIEGESIDFIDLSTDNPDGWNWGFEGGDPSTSADQNPAGVIYNSPGTYNVYLIASNIYGSDSLMKAGYIYVGGVGIDESNTLENAIYPNPTEGVFHIDLHNIIEESAAISIISAKGNVVKSLRVNTSSVNHLTMDISNQSDGIYYVVITTTSERYCIKTIKR